MTMGLDLQDASRRQQREYKIKADIQDIARIMYQHGICDHTGMVMTEMQRQKIARQIMSEVMGYNTAEIDIPVTFKESPYYDEEREKEMDKQVDDMLAQIKSRRARATQNVNVRVMNTEDADRVIAVRKTDVAFDDAMKILEKK